MCLHSAWLILLIIQPHFLDDSLDEVLAIGSVINGEVRRKAKTLVLIAKNTKKNGMESPHPNIIHTLVSQKRGNTRLHFVGCLVRKRQSKDGPRLITLIQQICNFISKDTGFARTSTCNHQRGCIAKLYSLALRIIKSRKKFLRGYHESFIYFALSISCLS